jgi:hypothetical protein
MYLEEAQVKWLVLMLVKARRYEVADLKSVGDIMILSPGNQFGRGCGIWSLVV